jgi:hypothetical protein
MEKSTKDLQDDLLKLVRYKVLFVRRDYEVSFPEEEDLVSDNLTQDSFVAWKIAEFIQDLEKSGTAIPARWRARNYPTGKTDGGFLTGIPHEDKKYLRVYYEVLERYPREKFKYEEQQIRVLEQIRDKIGARAAADDPYAPLLDELQQSSAVFSSWREDFRRYAEPIAGQLADILNQYGGLGNIAAPPVTAEDFARAFGGKAVANPGLLDRFSASRISKLQVFIRKAGMPASDVDAPPSHSIRARVIRRPRPGVALIQKVAESYTARINPEDPSAVGAALAQKQVDLHVYAYLDGLGLVTWSWLNQGQTVHLRGIGYEVNGKILFFKQMLNADKTPLSGPMPSAPFVEVVENQFVVTMDFLTEQPGTTGTIGVPINFNFDRGKADFQGLILKFTNQSSDQAKS